MGVSGWIAKSVIACEYGGTPCGLAFVTKVQTISDTKRIVSEVFLDICFLLKKSAVAISNGGPDEGRNNCAPQSYARTDLCQWVYWLWSHAPSVKGSNLFVGGRDVALRFRFPDVFRFFKFRS